MRSKLKLREPLFEHERWQRSRKPKRPAFVPPREP
jgi:hypothetical protein